jgi:hypothetical protein
MRGIVTFHPHVSVIDMSKTKVAHGLRIDFSFNLLRFLIYLFIFKIFKFDSTITK